MLHQTYCEGNYVTNQTQIDCKINVDSIQSALYLTYRLLAKFVVT